MISMRWIGSLKELEALGERYERFVERLPDVGLFYRLEWLRRVWPLYQAHGGTMACLVAERKREPVALAPFEIERKGWLRGRTRILRCMGQISGPLRQWEPQILVADPDDVEPSLAAMRGLLRRQAWRWDLMELELMPKDAPTMQALAEALPEGQLIEDPARSALVDLTGGFEAYFMGRLNYKARNEVKRRRKHMEAEAQPIRFEESTEVTPGKWEELGALHIARQAALRARGDQRISHFEDPLRRRALSALLEWGRRDGCARHYWLYLQDRLAAYFLCFHRGRTLFPYLTAMDSAFAQYGPAKQLFYWMAQREAEVYGTQFVNMGLGMNSFKSEVATDARECVNFRLINPWRITGRWRAQWLLAARRARERVAHE